MGGVNESLDRVKSVELYHLQTRKWSSLPDLKVERQNVYSCCHDGYIYIFGGNTDWDEPNSIERLDLSYLQAILQGSFSGSAWELIEPTA